MQKHSAQKAAQPRRIQDLLKNMPVSEQVLSADELLLQAAEISKQAAEKLAVERNENRQKRAESLAGRTAIPARYRNAELMPKTSGQMKAFGEAQEFVENFQARLKSGAGMLLWGDVGTGKTHLSCAIANALIAQLRPVLYCTALEAVMLVKATWNRRDMSEYDVYERFGEPELLIIDELGVQVGSDYERMVLTSIADIRSRNCLPTIIISNLSPEEIYGAIGERAFDRLVGFGANVVHMTGRSLRLQAA